MTRVYIIFGGILALVLAFVGLWQWGQQGHKSAREATEKAQVIATQRDGLKTALNAADENARKSRAAILKRLEQEAKLRKQAEKKAKELNDALKANPDWAKQPVPDSVWDAIAGPSSNPGQEGAGVPAQGLPNP